MRSVSKMIVAGACALGVSVAAMPAEAAQRGEGRSTVAPSNTIAGIRYDQIQKVDRRGGWRGGGFRGGRGWGGGGRRHFGGGGWGGRRYYGGGRRYYGGGWGGRRYYGGYRRHRGYGGYYAAGALGLVTGGLIASSYYDRPYGYYDRPYYGDGYYRRAYYGSECQVIVRKRDRYGRPIRVVRYRPC